MIAVICEFGLPSSFTPQKARAVFRDSTSKFEEMPGLIRKYFLLSEDGKAAASVYLWETRTLAKAFFTGESKVFMAGKYGHRPTVTFFERPIGVDNHTGEVIKDN